jgi:type II secretory pathway pseudopilin PulG
MVVIAIISILSLLVLTGAGTLRSRQRVLTTMSNIDSLQSAITAYLDEDASSTFIISELGVHTVESPLKTLLSLERGILAKMQGKNLYVVKDASGVRMPQSWHEATHMSDGWSMPIDIQVQNEAGVGNFPYTRYVLLRSEAGTPGVMVDDIVVRWDREVSKFEPRRMMSVASDGSWVTTAK